MKPVRSLETNTVAESSIGTLIIFIAMVLVATITAGVLFDTVGLIGGQTEQTSEETASELADRLEVVTITGNNITETDGNRTVNRVEVIVTLAEGSEPINLENVTVRWVGNQGFVLQDESTVDDPNTETFSTATYADPDGSFPVLTETDDRFALQFEPGTEFGDSGLVSNEQVQLTILSPTGSQKEITFTVPRSLVGKDSVEM
jgi:flagellin FlaB